jgi:23S rRNA (uracil1939-C5)-methyltransferase
MHPNSVKITSFAPTGHGITENGWYVLGAFPGETIKAQIYKEAEGIIYAELLSIVDASPHRTFIPTESPFFDPNAPWQYLDQEHENNEKLSLVKNIYNQIDIKIKSDILKPGSLSNHYRNKAAYAFTYDQNKKISFTLFTRGIAKSGKITQLENILVHPIINKIGKQFLHFFNQKSVNIKTLKYLTLRYSYHTNTVVAQILVTETSRKKLPWKKSELEKLTQQHPELQGIIVSHSTYGNRSSATTKDFYITGNIEITEKILEKKYLYHPTQFFQIYPDAFAQILQDCETIIENIPNHKDYELLDFFAGIGIIGLHMAYLVQSVHGVEQSRLAGKYARKNAKNNAIENFRFSESNVDQALDYINENQIRIVDPARSGLTKKSLEKIIEFQPAYIIYISCNPETQAENYYELKDYYDITWSRVYNLFPKTPHIEHVIFLTKKAK